MSIFPGPRFPERCPDGSWSKRGGRRCALPMGHVGEHVYASHVYGPECSSPGNCPQAGCPLCDPDGALAPA